MTLTLHNVILTSQKLCQHNNKCDCSKTNGRERSGSVVECLTRDRRAAGSSLTGVTPLWSLSKTHLSWLSTGSTQEDPSLFILKIVDGT